MKTDGHFIEGYHYQLAVNHDHQVIVAVGLSNQPPDFEHLEPMLQRIAASAGALPDVMTMDAGYWSEVNANTCAAQSIDAYISTGRQKAAQCPRMPMQSPHGPKDQKQ